MRGMSPPSVNMYAESNMPAYPQHHINATDGARGSSMPLGIPNSSAHHGNSHSTGTQHGPSPSDVCVDSGMMAEDVVAKFMRLHDAVGSGPPLSALLFQEADKPQVCRHDGKVATDITYIHDVHDDRCSGAHLVACTGSELFQTE
jgi:hypothetical protein